MLEPTNIVCPNCGAVNKQYGKCEYCGSNVEPDLLDIENGEVEIRGKYKVNYDERVLVQKYDKFDDKTITYCKYCDKRGFLTIKAYYENDVNQKRGISLVFENTNTKRGNWFHFSFPGDKCVIHIDKKKNYEIDYEISTHTLLAICEAKSIAIKVSHYCPDYIVDP